MLQMLLKENSTVHLSIGEQGGNIRGKTSSLCSNCWLPRATHWPFHELGCWTRIRWTTDLIQKGTYVLVNYNFLFSYWVLEIALKESDWLYLELLNKNVSEKEWVMVLQQEKEAQNRVHAVYKYRNCTPVCFLQLLNVVPSVDYQIVWNHIWVLIIEIICFLYKSNCG